VDAPSLLPERIRQISLIDPAFSEIISSSPISPFGEKRSTESNFSALIRTILSQQLSTQAAITIISRVLKAVEGEFTPRRLHDLDVFTLRTLGCSATKIRAIQSLARSALEEQIPFATLDLLSNEEIFEHLTSQFGIGKWTVDIFLMFQLGREDIWPVGDLGVRRGWQLLHGLENEVTIQQLSEAGEQFLNLRSHVAWYCWKESDAKKLKRIKM
jgi:DNA-3-methyladenine glycosylase II